ncbi:MAG: cytochrome c [Gemmatimonadota bacterium]|nr:cytochrome c [Gemmatimonadota bacterium]
MRRPLMIAAVLVVGLGACAPAGDGGSAASTTRSEGATAGAADRVADYDAGAVPGGPGKGARFGLGRAASVAQVSLMDHDIGPEGAELPAGRGTGREGAALYAVQCAACHGPKGEGIAPLFPQLIGREPAAEDFRFATDPKLPHTIGNYWPYATTVFDYIKRAMPLTAPGSLTDAQVYALTAFLLSENGVIADSMILDAASLRQVRMPYRDRFVPDDRKGTLIVK